MPAPSSVDLEAEERRHVGDARRLLHVVRDDHDRVVAASARASDPRSPGSRSDRARRPARPCRTTSRLDGDRSARCRDAAAARPRGRARSSLSRLLTSSQSAARWSAALDAAVEVVLHPEDPEAEGDVVVDRLRERVRLLEDHADPAPAPRRGRRRRRRGRCRGRGRLPWTRALGTRSFIRLRQRRACVLPQPDGPMKRRDRVLVDVERDAANGRVAAVVDGEIPHLEDRLPVVDCLVVLLRDLRERHRLDGRDFPVVHGHHVEPAEQGDVMPRVSPRSLPMWGAAW